MIHMLACTALALMARQQPGIDLTAVAAPNLSAAPKREVATLDLEPTFTNIVLPNLPSGANARFPAADRGRAWMTRLPQGAPIPSAAYGAGKIFVGGGFSSRSFYALDAKTGRIEWSRHDLGDDGPTAPLYDEGAVIFNTESCTLFVLDAKTGRTLWSKWLGDPTLSQPALAGGLVYAAFPSASGPMLGAFRAADGRRVWAGAIDGELLSAPVVDGDAVYATTLRGTTYRFDRERGRRLWTARESATSAPFLFAGELYQSRRRDRREEQIVLGAETGKLSRILSAIDARYLRDVPRTIDDPAKVWGFEGSRPVIAGGRRFDTMGGEITASDPRTGGAIWRRRHNPSAGAAKRGLTPPAVAGAKLIFASYDGELYVLDVDTGLTVFAYRLGVPLHAQPIVAAGWVYVTTTTGNVIGLELGDAALDGWHMWGGNAGRNRLPALDG